MTLFRLDASIRAEGSHSAAVSDIVEGEWRNVHVNEPVIRRQVGLDPIPSTTWSAAVLGSRTPEASRTPDQSAAVAMAADLTDELAAADSLLFAVPLYNFGISQHFKAWVDLIITDPRMAAGSAPLLADKPTVLVVAHGGSYAAGTPREGWDHATGWIRRVVSDVWQLDLSVVETEFTQLGVNPALEEFAEVAQLQREETDRRAHVLGRALAYGSVPAQVRAA